MTNDEINLARQNYKDFEERKKILDAKKNELKKLKENRIVKKYILLKEHIEKEQTELEGMNGIEEAFLWTASHTKKSNELLVYMGSYSLKSMSQGIVEDDLDSIKYIIYKDIETNNIYEIKPKDKEKFESEHKIIYLYEGEEKKLPKKMNVYGIMFRELRVNFFKNILEKSQEYAVEELTNKKLVKGK